MVSTVGYVEGPHEEPFLQALPDGIGHGVDLAAFVRRLDLERWMLRPEALAGGVLTRETAPRDGGIGVYRARHTLFLDADIWATAVALMKEHRFPGLRRR
ncbi:hypothetical protein KUA19_13865 [Catellatospora sp. NEAU-YM18]|nr:hypothetical protein [Catellatospora tritici]